VLALEADPARVRVRLELGLAGDAQDELTAPRRRVEAEELLERPGLGAVELDQAAAVERDRPESSGSASPATDASRSASAIGKLRGASDPRKGT
jgi:hypothetical protein